MDRGRSWIRMTLHQKWAARVLVTSANYGGIGDLDRFPVTPYPHGSGEEYRGNNKTYPEAGTAKKSSQCGMSREGIEPHGFG